MIKITYKKRKEEGRRRHGHSVLKEKNDAHQSCEQKDVT